MGKTMEKFTERFFSAPTDSFFLFGPRGTGKSTWLKKTFPDAYLVDLLDDRTFRNHIAHPERIKQIVQANPRTRRYIIDEVQKAPSLLDSIHTLIEKYKILENGKQCTKRNGKNGYLIKIFYPHQNLSGSGMKSSMI